MQGCPSPTRPSHLTPTPRSPSPSRPPVRMTIAGDAATAVPAAELATLEAVGDAPQPQAGAGRQLASDGQAHAGGLARPRVGVAQRLEGDRPGARVRGRLGHRDGMASR